MKPSSVRPLLLISALLTPLAHAQDAPATIREIEQKVLLKQYQDSVRALAASADGADGSSPEAISKYVQWLVKVNAELDADAKASAAGAEDMRESASTLNEMAWRMITAPDATGRHPETSLKLATIALELCGSDNELKSNTLDTRARALFLLGRREEAVAQQEQALSAATVAKKAGMEATLTSYQNNQLPEISSPAGGEQINYRKLNSVPLSKDMRRIVDKLDKMILPALDFEDVPLEEVIGILRTKSVELDDAEPDPARKGLNIVVRPPAAKQAPAASARVKSLHLRNVPFAMVLKYICDVTGMRFKVDDSAVTLVSASEANSELYTRSFRVPPEFPSLIASNSPSGADRPIQDLLEDNGILFGEGSSASLSGAGVLLVTNTPPQLDKLEQLIQLSIPDPTPAKPVAQTPPDPSRRTLDKLNNIIIPSVDFDDVSLDEAVEFIRNRSIELDAAEPDPMRKGMDFVIRPRADGTEPARIKGMRLRNVPVAQALKYICDATASRLKVEGSAVTVVSQADAEELLTRRFKVPVDFVSAFLAESGAPADAPRPSISKLFESNGIRFGEGCSVLLTAEGLLLVTNTPGELDKLEMLVLARGGTPSPVAQDAELLVPTEGVTRIKHKLREIVIPSIQLENVSLEAAVDLLRKKSVEFDTAEPISSLKGLNLVVRPRANDPEPLPIKSLRLRNVPLGEALKYVCQLTRMRYKVDDFAVMLASQDSTTEDLFTRSFSVPPDFTSILEPPSGSEEAAADPSGKKPPVRVPVQELLKANGILFREGSSASMASGRTLIVTNTPMELDKLEQLILTITPPPEPAKPVVQALSGTALLTNKLEKIILPKAEFVDISLEEAVDFLRQSAKELDTESDPARKGMNFLIRRPRIVPGTGGAPQGGAPAPSGVRIKEIRLRNVPLSVALKYICDATRMRYKVDDFAVTLVPQSEVDNDIFTRVFRVRFELAALVESAKAADAAGKDPDAAPQPRQPVVEWLKFHGIHFPEGTSAALGTPGILLVTNNPTELDKIEQLLAAMGMDDQPVPGVPGTPHAAPDRR